MKTPGFPHRLEVCESLPDLWCLNICPMHKHTATYHQTRKTRTKGKDKTIDNSNQKRTIIIYMIYTEVDLYTIYAKIKVHETLMIKYIKCHVSELFYCCDKTGRDKSRKERSWFIFSEGSVLQQFVPVRQNIIVGQKCVVQCTWSHHSEQMTEKRPEGATGNIFIMTQCQ